MLLVPLALAFSALVAAPPALAAKRRPEPPRPSRIVDLPSLADPMPVDQLREQVLRGSKSPKARTVARAYEAFRARKFEQARRGLAPLLGDELFGDHALWITASSWWSEALQQLGARQFDAAQRSAEKAFGLFQRIEASFPGSALLKRASEDMGRAELAIADSLHGRRKWKPAEAAYERAFQRLSSSVHVLTSIVRDDELGAYAEACSKAQGPYCPLWVQRLVAVYPKGSEEIKAISKFLPEAAEHAQAPRPGFTRMSQPYRANDLDQTAFDAAMGLYLEQKYKDSVKEFGKFLDEYPKSAHRHRARYWLAQALTQQQEHESAQKVYAQLIHESPLTYYGLLGALALGRPMDAEIGAVVPGAASNDPFLYPSELVRLRRAERFLAEGSHDLAAQELKDFRPRDTLSNPFLLYVATLSSEAGNHNGSFIILSDLIQRGFEGVYSSFGLKLVFPVVHLETIQKHAALNKIDPILVLSLMKQESAFDPAAVSVSGAAGLMQLMPSTAFDTEAGVKRTELNDVETNIRVGTKYLKKLLTRFNGNIVYALAGYNAGPNAVDRWVRDGRAKRGMLEFIESIPYKETREYVGSIVRNYFWYSRKITGETPKGLSYFWNSFGPPELPTEAPAETPGSVPSPAPAPVESET
jgi:tetratricopeptide (TPR) repeat protein